MTRRSAPLGRALTVAAFLAVAAGGAPARHQEAPDACRAARTVLADELDMATHAEPDSIDDVRTRRTLPGCQLTAAGLTEVPPRATARTLFERLRAAGWVRTPDPLDFPNESSLRLRKEEVDCLFSYVAGGLLYTDAALEVDARVVPGPGQRRYNVVARCVPAMPAAPGASGGRADGIVLPGRGILAR